MMELKEKDILKLLEKALKPFASVASWESDCQEMDRNAELSNIGLSISTGGMGSGYSLKAKYFREAEDALRQLDSYRYNTFGSNK